ncbi:hypothetical protein C0J52_27972 [Blattella germanica]|nr:hypothetical protein C0J52_27972 [Blattella germanica]
MRKGEKMSPKRRVRSGGGNAHQKPMSNKAYLEKFQQLITECNTLMAGEKMSLPKKTAIIEGILNAMGESTDPSLRLDKTRWMGQRITITGPRVRKCCVFCMTPLQSVKQSNTLYRGQKKSIY